MGTIITYPVVRHTARASQAATGQGPATIIILPVVRIERHVDLPPTKETASRGGARKRKRRVARS